MSTIKSSAENLTLNADGANNDIKFQSNGSEVASIDQAGVFTAGGGAITGLISNTVNVSRAANAIRSNATNLLVENTHASGAAGIRLKGGSGEASIIYGENNATDKLYIMPRNDTGKQVVIDHVGKIGIGTAAPLRQLHISNTSANSEIAFTSGTSGTASILFGDGLTGTDVYKGYIQYQHNGDYMDIATGATTRLRVDSDGLKFNADTAAANALDDYEEGTYIPTLTGSTSGSFTTSSYRYLAYTKIGRLVHIQGYLNISSESSCSGTITISLPFTPASGLDHDAENAAMTVSLRDHGGSGLDNITGTVSSAGMRMVSLNGSGADNPIDSSDVDTTWNVRIGGCYIAT